MSTTRTPGSGGLVVTSQMRRFLDRPGHLTVRDGGQTLRDLYRRNSFTFSPGLLNEFAQRCFCGGLAVVRKAVEEGTAPDLSGGETGYHYGYVALVLFGAQRMQIRPGEHLDHLATLRYLLEHGAPPDVPDVLGYTALHHACMAYPRADIARILLEHGANPDAQDRFGDVALMGAFQNNSIDAIEVLMEFGARLDVADADGYTPDNFFKDCGPAVAAVILKWKRKRAGEAKPLDEKVCATCKKSDAPLKICSACHTTWYCSSSCQKRAWSSHKRVCGNAVTVTVKPFYPEEKYPVLMPAAEIARMNLGLPQKELPSYRTRAVQKPEFSPGETKKMIVKVQVPQNGVPADAPPEQHVGDLAVYDKKHTLACRIRKQDGADAYMQLSRTVRTKGALGAKAYFSAEMKSPDALVIKVSEVLAEQPF